VFGFLRTLVPLIVANAAGTVLGAMLLAGLDQKTFAVLITAMVVLFLARGDRIVGEPGARRAWLLTPVVGFVGGVMQATTSSSFSSRASRTCSGAHSSPKTRISRHRHLASS